MRAKIDVNTTLLDLMALASEAIDPEGSEPSDEQIETILAALLDVMEHLAPERMGDPRVTRARALLLVLEQFRTATD